jgi:hypothetical protein
MVGVTRKVNNRLANREISPGNGIFFQKKVSWVKTRSLPPGLTAVAFWLIEKTAVNHLLSSKPKLPPMLSVR